MNKEGLSYVQRTDYYLRRDDSIPGRKNSFPVSVARRICALEGEEYITSWQKRYLVDLPVSLLTIVPATILTAGLCSAVWLEDGGPLFFIDKRMGKNGETINVRKIRSMRNNAPSMTQAEIDEINLKYGPAGDPRNTKVGGFIRKFELDELPQLWQVIKGDLSLCGIRVMNQPAFDRMAEVVDRRDIIRWKVAYNRCRGIFNPNASRIRHRKEDKKRVHDDILYDKRASLGLDYYLIITTAIKMGDLFAKYIRDKAQKNLSRTH